jgi:hypothetical protein
MVPTFKTRKPFHRRHARSAAGRTPPPVPGPRVVLVRFRPLESDGVLWTFSEPIDDPTGDLAELAIAGVSAISFDRVDATSLIVWYDGSPAPGDAWSNIEGAAGIVGTDDGLPLVAGSGTVAVPVEQVVTVNRLDEQHVLWYFQDPVASIDGACLGLKVGGLAPTGVEFFDEGGPLLCTYDAWFPAGEPWQLVAGAVQLTFDPPHDLVDGSGTVQG